MALTPAATAARYALFSGLGTPFRDVNVSFALLYTLITWIFRRYRSSEILENRFYKTYQFFRDSPAV